MAGMPVRVEVIGRLTYTHALGQHISGKRVQVTVGGRRAGLDLDWITGGAALAVACLMFGWFRKRHGERNEAKACPRLAAADPPRPGQAPENP